MKDKQASRRPWHLEICLLGGFEVSRSGEAVAGFESQSVRALLAYLACHAGRALSREVVAGLLWPEEPPSRARHNLRQALYNLRTALSGPESGRAPLSTTHQTVRFDLSADVLLDVEQFDDAIARGRSGRRIDSGLLTRAAQLYRGPFLDGFYLRDSPDFEEWLLGEQERLREGVLVALRELVAHHLDNGSYPLGLQYVRQLLKTEPFSEEAHRQLMRLYAMSGRRSRALAHFEELRRLFHQELGVEPMEETRALAERLQAEEISAGDEAERGDPSGPLIPMVDRGEALDRLRRDWHRVQRGSGCLTLVEGEAGVGKTRLVKTFLHEAASAGSATVLLGRCYELAPARAYQPFAEALRNVVANEVEVAERIQAALSRASLARLAALVPELAELDPKLTARKITGGDGSRRLLHEAVVRFLTALTQPGEEQRRPRPVILFADDLQWADRSSFDLLRTLLEEIKTLPLWIVATYRTGALPPAHPLRQLAESGEERGDGGHLTLGWLAPSACEEIASALVGPGQARELGPFLYHRSEGLPLAVVETINLLWDEGLLVPQSESHWNLRATPKTLEALAPMSPQEILLRRVDRLARSIRRLLTLAAVVGQKFEAEVLRAAEGEHEDVVATAMAVLIERWMVRHFPRYWADSRRERDLALWRSGAHHGVFEFAHNSIRSAVYESLSPERRRALHASVARTLEQRFGARKAGLPEELAHHYVCAGEGDLALPHLERAGEQALRLGAWDTARHYLDEAAQLLDAAEAGGAEGPPDAAARRQRITRALAELGTLEEGG